MAIIVLESARARGLSTTLKSKVPIAVEVDWGRVQHAPISTKTSTSRTVTIVVSSADSLFSPSPHQVIKSPLAHYIRQTEDDIDERFSRAESIREKIV